MDDVSTLVGPRSHKYAFHVSLISYCRKRSEIFRSTLRFGVGLGSTLKRLKMRASRNIHWVAVVASWRYPAVASTSIGSILRKPKEVSNGFIQRILPSTLSTTGFRNRGGEWSFKNSGSRKILVEFQRSRSLVFRAVMCVLQSRFLYEVSISQSQKSKCLGLAKKNATPSSSRIHHSPPLEDYPASRIDAQFE